MARSCGWLVLGLLFSVTELTTGSSVTDLCPSSINLNPTAVWTYKNLCLQLVFSEHDWPNARKECQKHGGDLVQIRSQDMQNSIEAKLREQHRTTDSFWIGATDEGHESTWTWVTGDPVVYEHWSSGQGSKHGFFIGGGFEDCARLRVDEAFYWHDYSCTFSAASSICQYDLTATTTQQPTTSTSQSGTTTTTTSTTTAFGNIIG